jgi:phage gp16-like protein
MPRLRPPVADRNRQLGRIHAGKKALGLDDDTYRALLERVTGKRSSADMTGTERNAVLAELARLGFKAEDAAARKRRIFGRPKNVDEVPMLRKVEALLTDSRRPWSYAHAMAKRMFHRDRLEFLRHDELHKLVAALQADANRRDK